MILTGKDPIRPWFEAVEATGDCATICLGRLAPGADEVEWTLLPHQDADGMGVFGGLLRRHGVELPDLPENLHPCEPSWGPFLRSLPKFLVPRRQLKWRDLGQESAIEGPLPVPVLAWHVFSEDETLALRDQSKAREVSLNSYLMKAFDNVVRRDLVDPSAPVPWMVPVNVRGKVRLEKDTDNHTSYLSVRVRPEETDQDLHREIYRKLEVGEHWANWMAYQATRPVPRIMKSLLYRTGYAMSEWNIGAFTNLGIWDPKKEYRHPALQGSWLFCSPVLRCQRIAAGLLTFQGRLSVVVRIHPELTTDPTVPKRWLQEWITAV